MIEKNEGNTDLLIREAKQMSWYHTIELTNGFTTDGMYDLRPCWEKFNFPDLRGKTVLDVGPADGFFSFEFEKRGAIVTALDIPSQEDRDDGQYGTGRPENTYDEEELNRGLKGADFRTKFNTAKKLLNSRVERIEMNLYEMSKNNIGQFDVVFCSDVLLHLTDPVRALTKMKDVCKGIAIISTPIYSVSSFRNPLTKIAMALMRRRPLSFFIGADGHGAFWFPTRLCLQKFALSSGFKEVQWVSTFVIENSKSFSGERGVIHGLIN